MAFDIKETINKILSFKTDWDKANSTKNEAAKQQAATGAQKYYNQLKEQGYGNVAENLSQKNAAQAKSYADVYYKTAGNTEFRPYVYNLGKKYGLSNADVDKYISWNNDTGEISLGGKNIGRPAGVVDGRSYVSNTDDIDKAFEEAMKRSGITPSTDTMYNQSLYDTQNKINEQWDAVKNDRSYVRELIDDLVKSANANPLETDWGKAMMNGYSYKGLTAANNAAAKAAGSNGGNIDSYAAANAARQQASYIDQGMRRVMDYNDSRLSRVQQIIDQYSGYANDSYTAQNNNIASGMSASQQIFDNSETAKNNDVARKVQKSEVTGYSPDEWINEQTNPYFDANGNLINPDIDYQEQINNVKAKLAVTTDPDEKAALQATLYNLRNARIKKATSIPGYEKWIGTLESNPKEKTAALKENDSNNATTLKLAQISADTQADAANKELESAKYQSDNALEGTKYQSDNSLKGTYAQMQNNLDVLDKQAEITKNQTNGNVTKTSDGTFVGNVKVGDKTGKPILSVSEAQKAYENGNTSPQIEYAMTYYGIGTGASDRSDDVSGESDIETKLNNFYDNAGKTVKKYIRNVLEPDIVKAQSGGIGVDDDWLKEHLLKHSAQYDLEVEDLKGICKAFGVDTKWVDDYKNSGLLFTSWGSGVKKR